MHMHMLYSPFHVTQVRLFTTLIRFDAVYYHHFKCNVKRISELPNIHAYMCELYQIEAVKRDVSGCARMCRDAVYAVDGWMYQHVSRVHEWTD